MRVALAVLLATLPGAACKYSLDDHEFLDATQARLCTPSMSAPSCLAAEAENHSDFAWLQQNMFAVNCSGDDCHGSPANGLPPDGGLVLATGFAYKSLLGKDPTDASPAPLVASEFSPQHMLVQPGNPEASYLLFLLKGLRAEEGVPVFTPPPDDVGYMPQSNNTLCCQKLDAVRRWIEAGALP